MSYLAIIERLKKAQAGDCANASEHSQTYERNEFNEKSHAALAEPSEHGAELPRLGRKNDVGEMVMTVEDLPELESGLRLSGWKVERRGDQLICRSRRKPRVQ
jgi:hypothetical protein